MTVAHSAPGPWTTTRRARPSHFWGLGAECARGLLLLRGVFVAGTSTGDGDSRLVVRPPRGVFGAGTSTGGGGLSFGELAAIATTHTPDHKVV